VYWNRSFGSDSPIRLGNSVYSTGSTETVSATASKRSNCLSNSVRSTGPTEAVSATVPTVPRQSRQPSHRPKRPEVLLTGYLTAKRPNERIVSATSVRSTCPSKDSTPLNVHTFAVSGGPFNRILDSETTERTNRHGNKRSQYLSKQEAVLSAAATVVLDSTRLHHSTNSTCPRQDSTPFFKQALLKVLPLYPKHGS
jgi:hypothetical protein